MKFTAVVVAALAGVAIASPIEKRGGKYGHDLRPLRYEKELPVAKFAAPAEKRSDHVYEHDLRGLHYANSVPLVIAGKPTEKRDTVEARDGKYGHDLRNLHYANAVPVAVAH